MAGIYIHIPYCKQKCSYCNFHFSIAQKTKGQMLTSMKIEILDRKNYLLNTIFTSLYFGGGTPSILTIDEMEDLILSVRNTFDLTKNAEITLEANPDDLDIVKLKEYRRIGFNRLSIGIQSFNDQDLAKMNRAHSAEEAIRSIKDAKEVGFENISIDLIYGTPEMDMSQWTNNIQTVIDSGIQHISAYALTVEPNTLLNHQVKNSKIVMPHQDQVSDQFLFMIDRLAEAKFEQYEVSNFGKKDFYSKHNSSYWKSEPYIGIGPSAHSFDLKNRRWNVANNIKYIKAINAKEKYFSSEEINKITAFNEYIMLGLRTRWGIDTDFISEQFNVDLQNNHSSWFKNYQQYFISDTPKIILNKKGLLMADRIASDLMIVE